MADINMDNINIEIQSSSEKASNGVEQLISTLNNLNQSLQASQSRVENYTSSLEKISNVGKNLKIPDISIKSNIPEVSKELEYLNSKTPQIKMPEIKTPKVNTSQIKTATSEIENYKSKLGGLSSIADKTSGRVQRMISSLVSSRLAGVGNSFSGIGSSIASAGKKMLRLTTALFGIRSAFYAVRNISNEFLSSQDATARQLSANISYLKFALGSTLAPVIQFITNLIYNLLKAIQSIVYFLTKINIFSKASAKNFASGAGGAAKTTKELKKQLQAFDELHNITLEDNSGGGSGGGGGIMPSFDLSEVDSVLPKFAEMLLNGDWYELGFQLGQKINEVLESIPWDKIKATAGKIGKNLALLLNGILDGTNWNLLGKTFAEGLNTVIEFGYNFVTTFNYAKFGQAIGDTINGFFLNVDWAKLAKTISGQIKGIFDTLYNAFKTIEWAKIGVKIKEFIFNFDWNGVTSSFFSALGSLLGGISAALASFINEAIVFPIADFLNETFTRTMEEAGGNVIEGFLNGIVAVIDAIDQWVYNNIVEPFVTAFCEALGIHSPSTLFAEFGNDIIQGLFNGMIQLVGGISKIAQDVWNGFTSGIQGIANWVNSVIIQPVINFFIDLYNNIIKIAGDIYNGFTNAILSTADWVNNTIIQPVIGFFTNLWNTVITIGQNIYNGFTGAISGIAGWINNTIIQPVVGAFNGLWNTITGIFNNIRNAIMNTLSNINIRIKLPHFSWSTQPASGWVASILKALNLPASLPKLNIDWYASGGYPNEGDLFVANEAGAEMVGSIGGKTAVANNDQITKAIAEATYQAITQALHENQDNNQPIIVNVGNETLYKGMTKSRSQASNQYGITV